MIESAKCIIISKFHSSPDIFWKRRGVVSKERSLMIRLHLFTLQEGFLSQLCIFRGRMISIWFWYWSTSPFLNVLRWGSIEKGFAYRKGVSRITCFISSQRFHLGWSAFRITDEWKVKMSWPFRTFSASFWDISYYLVWTGCFVFQNIYYLWIEMRFCLKTCFLRWTTSEAVIGYEICLSAVTTEL